MTQTYNTGEHTVRHTANLSKIKITDAEVVMLSEHFEKILNYFSVLDGLAGCEKPKASLGEQCALRLDISKAWPFGEDALNAAPVRDGDFYRVPRMGEE